MASRPDTDALVVWLKLTTAPVAGSAEAGILDEVLEAALEDVEEQLRADAISADADEYPSKIRVAVLMQAARWYKRRSSPEGVAAFGDFGPIRVMGLDADVEQLISRYLRLDRFA